jgi:hypothetical protein
LLHHTTSLAMVNIASALFVKSCWTLIHSKCIYVRVLSLFDLRLARLALNAITFEQFGQYVNPSRLDPMLVAVRPVDNSFLALTNNLNSPAIFVSTVLVNESHLTYPKKIGTSGSLKYMSGIFHTIEWERAGSLFLLRSDEPLCR